MMPQLARSISVTTRPRRFGERQGRDYHFVSSSRFQRLRRTGQLLEWADVHEAHYGTLKRPVLKAIARGRPIVLSIDVQGARQIRRALGSRAVLIFLLPPSFRQLRERLLRRQTETAEAIRSRLVAAKRELACAKWYDYTVINDRLETAIRRVAGIIISRGAVIPRPGISIPRFPNAPQAGKQRRRTRSDGTGAN